jgi:hypothetical protein
MDVHAAGCAECARLLAELETLRMDAAALPALEPSRDLWAGIAERIDARVLPLDAPRVVRTPTVRRIWQHPAVAAAALILVTAGVTHVWTRAMYDGPLPTTTAAVTPTRDTAVTPERAVPEAPVQVASSSPAPRTTGAPTVRSPERATPRVDGSRTASQLAALLVSRSPNAGRIMKTDVEPVYDREIVKLRAIVRERRSQLDPRTVAVLEQSIAVIDSAIAQSRAALAKDPASGFLATQLNHSLEKKVELLRTAALLPART